MENEIIKICAEARRTVKKIQHEKNSPTSPKPTLLRNTIRTSQLSKTNQSTNLDSSHSIDEINSKANSNLNSSNTEGSVSESLYSNKAPCFKRRKIINMDSDFE
ncbi:hypothetical protein BpHYR1_048689 [Brachionus plicatilis]|uniref:Uncharacterized protein n=1 Tax=Brachionus plicatilis TaxID=10195 RepID=A0A3M7S4Q9_BRAPC|nr:hypothetical protein BpHYR1_048689 [Brachionus plicatilis]